MKAGKKDLSLALLTRKVDKLLKKTKPKKKGKKFYKAKCPGCKKKEYVPYVGKTWECKSCFWMGERP